MTRNAAGQLAVAETAWTRLGDRIKIYRRSTPHVAPHRRWRAACGYCWSHHLRQVVLASADWQGALESAHRHALVYHGVKI